MWERTKEVPMLHRLLLAACLGLLFLVSAGTEEAAKPGCCDVLLEGAVTYRLVFSPKAWDPAGWEKALPVNVELIEVRSGQPVECSMELLSAEKLAKGLVTLTFTQPDNYNGKLNVAVGSPKLNPGRATREWWANATRKGNEGSWNRYLDYMKAAEWALATDTFVTQGGDGVVTVAAYKEEDLTTIGICGAFRFRPPWEKLLPPP